MLNVDEDLLLFHQMHQRELHSAAVLSPPSPIATSRSSAAAHDIFDNLDSGKNDYDWLLTPPTTPLLPTLDLATTRLPLTTTTPSVGSLLKTSKSEPPSRAEPSARGVLRGNLGFQQPTNGPSSSITTSSRRSPSSSSNTVSRPSTSSSNGVGRPSTPSSGFVSRQSPTSSNASARPSTPSGSAGALRLSVSSTNSGVCSSSPSSRTPTPSSTRPASASFSRPSTPVRRPGNPGHQPNSLTRSSSVSNASSSLSKSMVSSRASSPTARDRAWPPAVLPGFSQEPPPNLRTSMLERSNSSSRVSSMGSRPGKSATARTTKAEAPDTSARNRQQSTSTLTPRNHLSSDSHNGDTTIHRNAKSHDAAVERRVSNVTGSKSSDKKMRFRKPVPSAQEEQCSVVNLHVKRSTKSATSQDVKSSIASVRDSSGFGRNLSKKSLDMALKHMDIHRSNPSGFRSSMSHILASSLFSVRSSNRRGVSTNSAADSPMATSSNTSSEHSMGIVLDPESSEAGDENVSEKGSKSSSTSLPESVVSHSIKTTVSSWLDSPDDIDDNAEIMQLFEQDIERLSGFESPLVSQHEGFSDCDDFTLEPV